MSQSTYVLGAGTVTPRDVEAALSPQPVPAAEEISDLELAEEPQSEPTKEVTGPSCKTEIVEMKYPIDIKNIIPRDVRISDVFCSVKTPVYDVTCFNSVKYHLSRVGYDIKAQYPGYEYKIYAYRATKRFHGTAVNKLKLDFNVNPKKKFVHVNVELLE